MIYMKKISLLIITLLVGFCALAQVGQKTYSTTTPVGTTSLPSVNFRYTGITPDSLNRLWIYNPLTGRNNRLYTATESNSFFVTPGTTLAHYGITDAGTITYNDARYLHKFGGNTIYGNQIFTDGTYGLLIAPNSSFGAGLIWDNGLSTKDLTNFALAPVGNATQVNAATDLYLTVGGINGAHIDNTGLSIDNKLKISTVSAGATGNSLLSLDGTEVKKLTIGSGLSVSGGVLNASGGGGGGGHTYLAGYGLALTDTTFRVDTSVITSRTRWNTTIGAAVATALSNKQPLNAKLTAIATLTNAPGALVNNGSGTFSYSAIPTASDYIVNKYGSDTLAQANSKIIITDSLITKTIVKAKMGILDSLEFIANPPFYNPSRPDLSRRDVNWKITGGNFTNITLRSKLFVYARPFVVGEVWHPTMQFKTGGGAIAWNGKYNDSPGWMSLDYDTIAHKTQAYYIGGKFGKGYLGSMDNHNLYTFNWVTTGINAMAWDTVGNVDILQPLGTFTAYGRAKLNAGHVTYSSLEFLPAGRIDTAYARVNLSNVPQHSAVNGVTSVNTGAGNAIELQSGNLIGSSIVGGSGSLSLANNTTSTNKVRKGHVSTINISDLGIQQFGTSLYGAAGSTAGSVTRIEIDSIGLKIIPQIASTVPYFDATQHLVSSSVTPTELNYLAGITAPIVSTSTTQTLTNKRITHRVSTTTSGSTITPTGDASDIYTVTALATNATFAAPSGTPTDGQPLLIRIKSDATPRTLTFNSIYRWPTAITPPTTTTASKTMYIQTIYNSADTKWDVVGFTNDL